jgi:L-ascorbate metabolism protein UlaG (beta-lactamase superfamily)
MKITYYGQSCFGAELNGKALLFDPFISPNELARDINLDRVPDDYLLISHGHQDQKFRAANKTLHLLGIGEIRDF